MLISRFKENKKHKFKENKKHNYYFNNIIFGAYGLKLLNTCLLTSTHIEVVKKLIVKRTLKTSLLWVRGFPNYSKTKKANKVRMGKGKGKILLELDNLPHTFAKVLLNMKSFKNVL